MRNYIRKISAAILSAVVITLPMSNAFAKSYSLINGNMDYRKSLVYKSEFNVYVKTFADNYPYYGAKFEPRSGIYIGTPYNKKYPGINNAVDTQYDWFVPKDEIKNNNVARKEIPERQSDHTVLKGINLNFALKNNQVIDIREYSNYIYNKLDEYASWGQDILLVFGKEMNIDDNFNDPELFKDCFRFVADYAHTKENIAMVWAPNDMGGLDTTLAEFYPGDEYVDWIGCSLYTMPYFQGREDGDLGGNMLFGMREFASPALHAKMIHSFITENNIKKPVMITEGGVGYESPLGKDYTEFAKHQYRLYYGDLCRRYPEFKCIISFNEYVKEGDLYRYDASRNPELLSLMQEITADPIYLKSYPSSAPYSYMEMFNGMEFTDKIELSAFAYIPSKQNLVVRYLIDGEWVSEKKDPPYAVNLDSSIVPYGKHILSCEIYDGTGMSHRKNYNISFVPSEPAVTEPPVPEASQVPEGNIYKAIDDPFECSFIDMDNEPDEMRYAVQFLSEQGIVNGLDGINYGAGRLVSRSEIAAMLMRIANIKESNIYCGLSDVSAENWYYGIINAAVNEGLITGYPDGSFGGDLPINRSEFIALMSRMIQRKTDKRGTHDVFEYNDEVPDWVKEDATLAQSYGIILERYNNVFDAYTYVSRGDAAVMLKRLYDAVNEL